MPHTDAIQNITRADVLREIGGEALFDEFAGATSNRFDVMAKHDPVPVIVCARDEAEDLPALLVSLASSKRAVLPIIIDDGSKDDTPFIAKDMGAFELSSPEPKGKAGALRDGLSFAHDELGATNVLVTDADTIVPPTWAGKVELDLMQPEFQENGGATYGPVVYRHGLSARADRLHTFVVNRRNHLSVSPENTHPAGFNTGLCLTDAILEENNSNALTIKYGEGHALRDAVLRAGGKVGITRGSEAIVITRGDRFDSVRQMAAVFVGINLMENLYQNDSDSPGVPYPRGCKADSLRRQVNRIWVELT